MAYIRRLLERQLNAHLAKGRSILLLGPRQAGKSTVLSRVRAHRRLNLANPAERQVFEREPGLFVEQIRALAAKLRKRPVVIVDEVQKVPELMDAAQILIDEKTAQLVLTGSSARKLRRGPNVNLLPGRVRPLRLDPLVHDEIADAKLEELLLFGSLPGILTLPEQDDREETLTAYSMTYLEEEVRAEGLTRNVAAFGRFLELAASESGRLVNFSKLSQDVGVAHTTIKAHYEILEDCLLAERVEPIIEGASRRRLTRAEKYLFFDLGVRRVCAREGLRPPLEHWGHLFEQWVGLELIRLGRLRDPKLRLRFWRDNAGPEVDWVLEGDGRFVPVEVKWTNVPKVGDAKNLHLFQREYPQAGQGYVLCRVTHAARLSDTVTALPWQQIGDVFQGLV